ncbi:MAG: DUF2459 domain-containing protein [Burkholderiales bacterium]|nr:DUF2459 domain-containing protein [Burkholderiales bacterium]
MTPDAPSTTRRTPASARRLIQRGLVALLALPAAALAVYLIAALLLGAIPVNASRVPPAQGVTVYLADNGVHIDFVLPVAAAGIDWRQEFRAAHFAAPLNPPDPPFPLRLDPALPPDANPATTHVVIGWGDAGFYFETPRWSDLRASVALKAAFGRNPSVVHVEYWPTPAPHPRLYRLVLTEAEYRRLVEYLRGSFARDPSGQLLPHPGRGYTVHDTFYAGTGSFSLILTCNEWARRGLEAAGVKTARWAPLPWGVRQHLP